MDELVPLPVAIDVRNSLRTRQIQNGFTVSKDQLRCGRRGRQRRTSEVDPLSYEGVRLEPTTDAKPASLPRKQANELSTPFEKISTSSACVRAWRG